MSGCDRCGHRKKDHAPLCVVHLGSRFCLCPKYLKPRTMSYRTEPGETK